MWLCFGTKLRLRIGSFMLWLEEELWPVGWLVRQEKLLQQRTSMRLRSRWLRRWLCCWSLRMCRST
jgi:hypothetical protein